MKPISAILCLGSMPALASAIVVPSMNNTSPTITQLTQAPDAGKWAYVYRLSVDVTTGDDWTMADGVFTALQGTWYQNAINDTNPPNPVFFTIPGFEDSKWTSFYTSPGDWPTTGYIGGVCSFASKVETPTVLTTDWFDTVTTTGVSGVIGQFTIVSPTLLTGKIGTVVGSVGAMTLGSQFVPFSYDLYVPEPGTLALLALGALWVIRGR